MGNVKTSPEKRTQKKTTPVRIGSTQREWDNAATLLFLGTAESGKTTLVKQLQIKFGDRYESSVTKDERMMRRNSVFRTILSSMTALLKASQNYVPLADPVLESAKQFIISENSSSFWGDRDESVMNDKIKDMLIALWNDEGIRETWKLHRSKIHAQESLEYYMSEAERVLKADYEPTALDWLHVRKITSGINTTKLKVGNTKFNAVDVGGRRGERKKWIYAFEGVTAVVFVSAISEYDEPLFENATVNRMQESLDLFEQMLKSELLKPSGWILLLNKSDVFKRKITQIPIKHIDLDDQTKNRWEDYSGPSAVGIDPKSAEFAEAYDAGSKYFADKFQALKFKHAEQEMHVQMSSAIDNLFVDELIQTCQKLLSSNLIAEQAFFVESP